jgi:hypothetical protein
LSDFIAHNKDVLTFCIPLFGVLLGLCFGGVLNWRHKICIDYEGRRDVAINILQDRYVQKTSAHHSEIAEESRRDGVEIVEIYKRKKQREMIRELAATLEDVNRVKRYFRWLERASIWAFRSLWICLPLTLLPLLSIWFNIHSILTGIWSVILVGSLLLFVIAISLMSYLDGQFFRLVNRIIEPDEGDE